MLKTALLTLFISGLAAAQTTPPAPLIPPPPPACLSGPVTKGSVTLTCSMIDNSPYSVAGDISAGYYLQVRAVSVDPDVVGMRIAVSTISTPPAGDAATVTRTVTPVKVAGAFAYTFWFQASYAAPDLSAWAFSISSISVQELKPSSSQVF